MATIATIDMLLRAQTAQFSRDMKRSTGELRGLKAQAASTAATLKGMAAGYLSFQLVKSQITSTFKEMEEDAKAARKLDAALTATGHSAGFSADQLQKMASDFQALSNFEDDAIANSEALLLTFRNIKGDNFKSTMQAALDLSTALDKDLNSSVMQLGKALNDPVKGMTQLRKVGILFSEDQKQQVKNFMAVGNAAAAQKVILDELAKSYGGQALSATNSLTGQTQDLKEAWDELKKSIIEPLTPGITKGIQELTALLKDAKQFTDTNDAGSAKRIQQGALGLMGFNAFLPDWKFGDAGGRNPRRPGGPGAQGTTREERRRQDDAAKEAAEAAARMAGLRDAFTNRHLTGRDPDWFNPFHKALGGGKRDNDPFFRDQQKPNGLMALMEAAKAAKYRLDTLATAFESYGRIIAETRTPAEQFKAQLSDLDSLFKVVNDPATHLRAIKKARQDLLSSARSDTPAALERGTAGAFSATRRGANDPLKNVDKNTLELVKKADEQIRLLEEQVRQGRNGPTLAEAKF